MPPAADKHPRWSGCISIRKLHCLAHIDCIYRQRVSTANASPVVESPFADITAEDTKEKIQQRRKWWVWLGRTSSLWENILDGIAVEAEYKENFRMTKTAFLQLCEELSNKYLNIFFYPFPVNPLHYPFSFIIGNT